MLKLKTPPFISNLLTTINFIYIPTNSINNIFEIIFVKYYFFGFTKINSQQITILLVHIGRDVHVTSFNL